MPFANHIRMTAIGTLGSLNKEIFQYHLGLDNGNGTVADLFAQNDQLEDCVADLVDFHGDAGTKISAQAVLRTVKFASIGADGRYIGGPKIFEVEQAGGAAHQPTVLPQNALACSLVTARRGPTGRGRFFIPMPVVSPNASEGFLFSSADAVGIAQQVEELVQDLNNGPGTDVLDAEPVVIVASTKGYNTPVTGVRVGRVVDTIRTRRNKLPETYTDTYSVSS